MKITTTLLAVLAFGASAFGQGQIRFQNRITTAGLFAPVYGVNALAPTTPLRGQSSTNGGAVNYGTAPLLVGTGFTAALWAAPAGTVDQNSPGFIQIATAGFHTAVTLPGIINGPTAAQTIPFALGDANTGVPVAFQIRAWDNKVGQVTTWAAALADDTVAKGASAITTANANVSPLAAGPITGLTSFNLTIVPEPGVIALGVLGLGALLLRRRK